MTNELKNLRQRRDVYISQLKNFSKYIDTLELELSNLLKSFETTNQNYSIAWEILEIRFNNKGRIINMYVQNFRNSQI